MNVNENLLVMQPGDQIGPEIGEDYLKIYLSGSLDVGGSGIPWQQKFINGLAAMTGPEQKEGVPDYRAFKFLVINPLGPANGEPKVDNPEYVQKMQWEQGMMQQCDAIFCNFLKKSVKISAISGLLLWAQSGKVVCRCPMESVFYGQVKILSDIYGYPMVGDTGSVIKVMETMFQSIPKFVELQNFNL